MVGKSNKFSVEGASWLEQVFEMIATRNPNDLANVCPQLSIALPRVNPSPSLNPGNPLRPTLVTTSC